jgi:hypothetical protein
MIDRQILELVFSLVWITDPVKVSDDVSQHGVDQAGRFLAPDSLNELHTLIDRRGMRYPIEKQDLVQRHPKGVLDVDFRLREVPVREPVQYPVQPVLPPENAVHKFVQQAFVGVAELS